MTQIVFKEQAARTAAEEVAMLLGIGASTPSTQRIVARRILHEMIKNNWSSSKVAKNINEMGFLKEPMEIDTPFLITHKDRFIEPEELLAFSKLFRLTVRELTNPDFEPVRQLSPAKRTQLAKLFFKNFGYRMDSWEDNSEYWLDIATVMEPDLFEIIY